LRALMLPTASRALMLHHRARIVTVSLASPHAARA